MRINLEIETMSHKLGDRRIITKFLWLPKTKYKGFKKELRWLEKASWSETYKGLPGIVSIDGWSDDGMWVGI
jgi:hypothetical protein